MLSNVISDIVLERGSNNERKYSNQDENGNNKNCLEDIEADFVILCANFIPKNSVVSNRRNELGQFKFKTLPSLEGLEYVTNQDNIEGQRYYGFMLFSVY